MIVSTSKPQPYSPVLLLEILLNRLLKAYGAVFRSSVYTPTPLLLSNLGSSVYRYLHVHILHVETVNNHLEESMT